MSERFLRSRLLGRRMVILRREPRMTRRLIRCCLAGVLCLAAPASAQENDPAIIPENVEKLPVARPILEYALAGGVLLGALAIGFMPSKRTKES